MAKDTGCPCTNFLTIPFQRHRTVGFVPRLDEAGDDWGRADAVFCAEPPPTSRLYRARVVCACEPGWTRIGGSTAVVYGRNGQALEEHLALCPDPIVLIVLYPGTRYRGGAAGRLARELRAAGRQGHVLRFDERPLVRVNAAQDPQVRVEYQWGRA